MTDANEPIDDDRRTVLKTVGAGAAAAAVTGTASAGSPDAVVDGLSLSTGDVQEALVVFRRREHASRLSALDVDYWTYRSLPIAFAGLTGSDVERVASWEEVRGVYANKELEWHNDDARELTNAEVVHGSATDLDPQADDYDVGEYTGESVHAAVIDTGTDPTHPDLADAVVHNFQPVGPVVNDEPLVWQDVAPADTDENGHGTHCSGSVAGRGVQSDGQFRGMAPDADLTVYSIGYSLLLAYIVSAWDEIITRKRNGETDIQVVSNSYGPIDDGKDFDPHEPINVAAWYAFQEGVVPLFSAGNSGPGTRTLSQYAKAPYTIGVAACHDVSWEDGDGEWHKDASVTGFSSRGRAKVDADQYDVPVNYDREEALENVRLIYDYTTDEEGERPFGVYRNDVGAPGNLVMSTLSPHDALQAYAALWGVHEQDAEVWYGKISGTSMSCPVTAGGVATIIDAYQQNHGDAADPLEVIRTVEATAKNYHPVDGGKASDADGQGYEYTAVNVGTGFVDVAAAAARAEDGDWATWAESSSNVLDNGGVY